MLFSAVAAVLLSTSVPAAAQTEWAFVSMVNAERVSRGLRPLSVDDRLVGPARSWSSVLATLPPEPGEACGLAHNPNLRFQVPQAAWYKLGENVACGDTYPEVVHRALMASPSHRANILNPAFDRIGVGVVFVGDTFFVTTDFMQPAEPEAAQPAGTVPPAQPFAVSSNTAIRTTRTASLAKRNPLPVRKTAPVKAKAAAKPRPTVSKKR